MLTRCLQNAQSFFQNSTSYLQLVIKKPRQIILENTYTGFAGLVAVIGSLYVSSIPYRLFGVGIIYLIILCVGILAETRKYKLYTEKTLPLPIVINIANSHDEKDALNSLFRIIEIQPRYHNYQNDIEKYLGITSQDLVFKYSGDIFNKLPLISFLQITKKLIEKVKAKTPQDSTIYLAYIGPVSVGLLIGIMLRREGMIIFQRNQNTNSYESVIQSTVQELNQVVSESELKKFTVIPKIKNGDNKKLTLAIDTSRNKINLCNDEIKNYGDLISLENASGNVINYGDNWEQYVKEIFSIINRERQHYEELKLVYSMPVSLAIACGVAIGDYWNILLTNFDTDTQSYRDLIRINEVKYYF